MTENKKCIKRLIQLKAKLSIVLRLRQSLSAVFSYTQAKVVIYIWYRIHVDYSYTLLHQLHAITVSVYAIHGTNG